MKINDYRCVLCQSAIASRDSSGLQCENGHTIPFIEETEIPVFDCENENTNDYTMEKAAEIHDNSLTWLLKTFLEDEAALRIRLISKLHLQQGQKILITGAGAGNDLPYVAKLVGKEGQIFAQDFSRQMLMSAVKRSSDWYHLSDHKIEFSVSDATDLPFDDGVFDAVYHFGGLNLFPDIPKGISEMDRVVKAGGRVVYGDEGLPPWLKNTEYGKMIVRNNPLCDFDPPLCHIPTTAREVNLSWAVGYCFYIIEYTASKDALPMDINLHHVGKRGGSINTRYFGVLEGVDPVLKASLYQEAEKQGVSRVSLLENLLQSGLDNLD